MLTVVKPCIAIFKFFLCLLPAIVYVFLFTSYA